MAAVFPGRLQKVDTPPQPFANCCWKCLCQRLLWERAFPAVWGKMVVYMAVALKYFPFWRGVASVSSLFFLSSW